MTDRTQRFVDALHTLENDGDVDTIAALFTDEANVSNPLVSHDDEGETGAAEFWSRYRKSFETIASEFRNITEQDGVAFLEWISTGRMKGGDIRYGGVSVLEFEGDRIATFRTYFDSAQLADKMTA